MGGYNRHMTAEMGHFLQVGPFRTHYLRAGQGPPLILLHGLGGSAQWWRPNLDALGRIRTVYAPDLPGHGLSDKPKVAYTLDMGRAFLLDFLEAAHLPSADLLGHSTGGLIALDFALAYPQRVNKLILVDSAGLGREVSPFLRLMALPLVGELLALPCPFLLRALLRHLLHDKSLITPELVEQVRQERSAPGFRQALLIALRHGVGMKGMKPHIILTERLPRLKPPALLLWGVQDQLLPFSQARKASGLLPSLRLHPFPHCGHVPNWERRDEFNAAVAEFLRE